MGIYWLFDLEIVSVLMMQPIISESKNQNLKIAIKTSASLGD